MCGIAGLIGNCDDATVAQLDHALAHRGPDGSGQKSFCRDTALSPTNHVGDIILMHRRLAILDPGPLSAQPMSNGDGQHWLIYNGEIYNYRNLRTNLELQGERFSSGGDSEVLLRLLIRDGVAAIDRIEGMFAFAWLDRRKRHLVLARDHLGIKPLYYSIANERLAFASEIPALLTLPWITPAADHTGIADFLAHGLTDHRGGTCFRSIAQVPSGHLLTIPVDRPDRAKLSRWWQVKPRSCVEPIAGIATTLANAVAVHLQADRPVGVTLSGGIDSSAILALVRRSVGPQSTVRAIGYQADDHYLGETRWMNMAANAAGADLQAVTIAPEDLINDLDDLVRCQGEPFGSSSIYAQYRVMRTAAGCSLPVMLGGQGADELFAGYPILQAARAAELLQMGDLTGARRLIAGVPGLRWRTVAGQLLGGWRRACGLSPRLPAWFHSGRLCSNIPDPYVEKAGKDLLRRRMRESLFCTSLPMLLRYEDRNAMRWGIENRVPFLHRPLVELALGLPPDLLVARDGLSKAGLREALRGMVPSMILERRDKIGFATPEAAWLQRISPWVNDVINNAGHIPPFLNLESFREHWQMVVAGQRPYSSSCWRTLNLLRWADLASVTW